MSQAELIVKSFAEQTIAKIVEYVRTTYSPKFELETTLSFSDSRNRSWGGSRRGRPFISLSLCHYLPMSDSHTFNEYKSFAASNVIGTVTGTWQKCLTALIAHEIGHAVQHAVTSQNVREALAIGPNDHADFKSHSDVWQRIYTDLRNKFVNDVSIDFATEVAITAKISSREKRDTTKSGREITKTTKKNGKIWYHRYFKNGVFVVKFIESPGRFICACTNDDSFDYEYVKDQYGSYVTSLKAARAEFGI
jgi:hypothetical protein